MFTAAVFASLLLFGGIAGVLAFGGGRPREALWYSWIFAMYFSPVWLETGSIGWPLHLDGRTMAALVAGVGFLLFPDPSPSGRWLVGDALVTLLLGVMIASEFQAGELRPLTGPEFARHWLLPYAVGRRFLRSCDDLSGVVTVFSRVIPFIAAYGLLEMITRINPVSQALAWHLPGTGLMESSDSLRMGLKRARGFAGHPITFGLMMTMLLPWALEAARQARAGWAPRRWRWLPWIAGAGAFSSVSRGAFISVMMNSYIYATLRARRLRVAMAVLAVLVAAGAYYGRESLAGALADAVGETKPIPMRINGKAEMYTGTNHRLLLFEVYREAMENAGPLGYGFHLEGLIDRFHIPRIFWSLDNAYILLLLKFGYVGLSLFLMLIAWALYRLGRVAWARRTPVAPLAGGMFGTVVAVSFAMFTCSLEVDYGDVFVFILGLAGNIHNVDRDERLLDSDHDASDDELDPYFDPDSEP